MSNACGAGKPRRGISTQEVEMFALLVVVAIMSTRNIIANLYLISDGEKDRIESFIVSAALLAFTIYAILNWI